MTGYLSERELEQVEPAEVAAYHSPVPTQMISNGEFNPLPQTPQQRQVEARIKEVADATAKKLGMSRRKFLATGSGMAAAFAAMNDVYGGRFFEVSKAEAAEPDAAAERAQGLAKQYIVDVQTHFVRDDFKGEFMMGIVNFAAQNYNPGIAKNPYGLTLDALKFDNYMKEIFLDSDTKISLLSGAPFDDKAAWFLSNDQINSAAKSVNKTAGSTRMLFHSLVTPKQPGWMDELDRCIAEIKPSSWKSYTIGDPLNPKTTKYPWRLDDEKVVYPWYEKAVKAGITTVCVHKGLMPNDYETSIPGGAWKYATVDDLGKAAKDWPQINFVIYHSALQPFLVPLDPELAEFEKTGYVRWVSDLAAIPAKYGVSNVYGELGTSFATTVVTNPRFCAAMMGTMIKGLGAENIVWGTDSVFHGSPQWQIEAMRRLEIPEDMQKKYGFAPLGPADGAVKNKIFGYNSAEIYKLDIHAELHNDGIAKIKTAYLEQGGERSNTAYGYVARRALA
jgi:predicted TIM-barrel fold metal-dependent hydrolase